MLPLTPQHLVIGGSAVLAGLSALALFGAFVFAAVLVWKWIQKRRAAKGGATATGNLSNVLPNVISFGKTVANSPMGKEVEMVMAETFAKVVKVAAHAAAAKYAPHLAPLITKTTDELINEELAKVTGAQAPANEPKNADVPSKIILPPGHPILDLLHKTLEARHQQDTIESKQQAPATK